MNRFLRVIIVLTAVSTAILGQVPAPNVSAENVRERLSLDAGWKFHLGDAASVEGDFGYGGNAAFAKAGEAGGPAKTKFNDSTWRSLNLPHDWAVELDFVHVKNTALHDHGFKPVGRLFPATSVGWYRRSFTIPASDKGKRVIVKFDGVFRDCIVWVNEHFLGRNFSGYSEFSFDITDYLKYGEKNILVVRVDATQYEGWFYEGAGIYRHVWLLKYAPLHIPEYGTFVSADVGPKTATLKVETKVFNQKEEKANARLVLIVVDKQGNTAGSASSPSLALNDYEDKAIHQEIKVSDPHLWSLENPYLYTLVSILKIGDSVIDRTETTLGIRTLRFDRDNGFFLNGVRVEIKGVCCHQDHAGVGSALPDALQEYRIRRLKEMGCNAYRTSHNPPTPELLDACDRLGMLVMDENRLMGSTPELAGQFERLILRDRNHPSVIIWSIGNEEWWIHNSETGGSIARSLKRLQRSLDPTRLCTYAANNGDHYDGVNAVMDVRGVNYIGVGDFDKYHREHPDQPIWGSEEASTFCTRGIYAVDTVNGYVTDYDTNKPSYGTYAEEWWKYYVTRPWMAGAFVWTGFDYRGEPSPYTWPDISSHFGIMDVCGFPKNNFYYYQSWWTDNDVLHIAPHWNWKGREGQPIDVWCQSNCDSVELFLNGKGLGRKIMERNSHLQWKVTYTPGVLEARGWRKGKRLTTTVETTGNPAAVRLTTDRSSINADGKDVSVVAVTVVDSKNREVDNADNLIKFEIEGSGTIIGVGNGNPSSHEPDKYLNGGYRRKLFSGKSQVIVQSNRQSGPMTLKASSDGLKAAAITISAEQALLRPAAE